MIVLSIFFNELVVTTYRIPTYVTGPEGGASTVHDALTWRVAGASFRRQRLDESIRRPNTEIADEARRAWLSSDVRSLILEQFSLLQPIQRDTPPQELNKTATDLAASVQELASDLGIQEGERQ